MILKLGAQLKRTEEERDFQEQHNQRLQMIIQDSYTLSGGEYRYRRVHDDLSKIGECCGKYRMDRIMPLDRIKAVGGYTSPRRIAGRPSVVTPTPVRQKFNVVKPNQVWVTDISVPGRAG